MTAQKPATFHQTDKSQGLVKTLESVPKTQCHHELKSPAAIGRRNSSASRTSGNPLFNDFLKTRIRNGHIHHKYHGRFKSSSTSSQSWSKEKTFIQPQDVFAKLEHNTGKLSSRSSSTRTSLHRRWVPAQQPSQSTKTQSALPQLLCWYCGYMLFVRACTFKQQTNINSLYVINQINSTSKQPASSLKPLCSSTPARTSQTSRGSIVAQRFSP